jgi:hypothetical protein
MHDSENSRNRSGRAIITDGRRGAQKHMSSTQQQQRTAKLPDQEHRETDQRCCQRTGHKFRSDLKAWRRAWDLWIVMDLILPSFQEAVVAALLLRRRLLGRVAGGHGRRRPVGRWRRAVGRRRVPLLARRRVTRARRRVSCRSEPRTKLKPISTGLQIRPRNSGSDSSKKKKAWTDDNDWSEV